MHAFTLQHASDHGDTCLLGLGASPDSCGFGAAGREGPAQHCVGDEGSVPRSPELSKEEHPITWRSWQGAE